MKLGQNSKEILKGLKTSLYYSLIIALLLLLVVLVYSIIGRKNLLQGIFTAYYYSGAFILIFAVPQFYMKSKNTRTGTRWGITNLFKNPDCPGYNRSTGEEGFWRGIFISLISVMLLIYAFIIENIYFYMGG